MHSSIFISALLAVGALSSPMLKRDVVTDTVVVTVVDYVYENGAPAPEGESTSAKVYVAVQESTPTPSSTSVKRPAQVYSSHRHHHSHTSSSVAPVAPPSSSSPVVVPTSVQAPPPPSIIPAQAPKPSSSAVPQPAPSPVNYDTTTPAESSDDLPKTFVSGLDPGSADYSGLILQHHNVHRSNHSASALSWNSTLAGYAKTKAQGCVWDESEPGSGGYGMNIAQGVPIGNISVVVTEQWYNTEMELYPGYGIPDLDTGSGSNFANWGHFSQVVWKGSESVGCYTQTACGANHGAPAGDYTVCMYYPPGNFMGDFTQVGSPLGGAQVYVTSDGTQGPI